jgi:threonine dehydrogenase-like Zn-dependent dehydrogenase
VKKAMNMVAERGLARTISHAQGALTSGQPTGYSAAGVVMAVGSDVHDIAVGDRVACAGAQCAHHAEVINVPRNLTVPIPDGLDFDAASTVTLGAIALQGVRRAAPTLGESFVVLGLGILGQLTWQLLKANGCRVIGTDVSSDRIDLGKRLGMDVGVYPEEGASIDQVVRLTDGIGADGVIITAASPSGAGKKGVSCSSAMSDSSSTGPISTRRSWIS